MVEVLVLMGVSGSGKTTVGQLLATRLGWQFVDADDYHSSANVAKMRRGVSLTDSDRRPWLDVLHRAMLDWTARRQPTILACSALKAAYRQRLSTDIQGLAWVYLEGSLALLRSRLNARSNHFMSVDLLRSQLDTLERPENALIVSIDQSPEAIAQGIIQHYGLVRAGLLTGDP
ncbi:MAG: gluconokinase [Cyanobacteria bacterium J06632_22]